MRRATPGVVTSLAAFVAVAAVVTGLGGVGVGAASDGSLSCADGDTGAEFLADGGLAVSDDAGDASFTTNPVVNDTALAFDNVTVLASGTARVVLEDATADTVCTGAVDATVTPVTVAPDGFGSMTVDGSLEALAYGPPDYASGTTDLAYNASAPVTVTLGDAPGPGTQVRAVDTDTNRTLANATVAADGTVELSLPAGVHAVDLRTAEGEPEPTLSISLSPALTTANDSSQVAVTVTNATGGDPVGGATVALPALGRTATTNATGVASVAVTADAGNYSVVASADRFRNTTATLTRVTYDFDRNELIDITELGAAAADYVTGDLPIAELGDVAAAYAQS